MRYFLSFLFIVGLVILAFILVVDGFRGSPAAKAPAPLASYANTATQVEVTEDGPINADQSHNELDMTVGSSVNQINVEQGYQGTIIRSGNYANNTAAYTEFLNALQLAGFNLGETGSKVNSNPSGYCATGSRYTYEIINSDGSVIQNFWSTSCDDSGTYKGNAAAVMGLFIAQFPDYSSITENADL
jgi:hypothetical protein